MGEGTEKEPLKRSEERKKRRERGGKLSDRALLFFSSLSRRDRCEPDPVQELLGAPLVLSNV
eukprot:scaffold74396_cov22-Tisochrysis_lutea.AAC.1